MSSSRKGQAIRQLSRDATQSTVSSASLSFSDIENDALMSTRPFDDEILGDLPSQRDETRDNTIRSDTRDSLPNHPHIRSTAKKLGAWQPYNPAAESRVTSSVVRNEFKDFDQDSEFDRATQDSNFTDDSISIERNRGVKRGSRNTPQHLNSSFIMSPVPLRDSLYDITPPANRASGNTPQQSPLAEPSSLRRDGQMRRASGSPAASAPPAAAGLAKGLRKTTLSQMHAMVTDDESAIDDQRPTVTLTKTARFGSAPSRREPAQEQNSHPRKSQQAFNNTPRSVHSTAQSFILPDLPNLTELVSGVFQDGTPVFNHTSRPRSHFFRLPTSPTHPRHNPIDSVPIPSEEKAIFASLQLLQEKVAQLEREKDEAEKRIEEQDNEIVELRATQDAQERNRRPDSGLGSTDGEVAGDRRGWRVEKTKLESSLNALRVKIDHAERKASVAEISTKRATSERDNLVTQLGVAYLNMEEVKAEKETLLVENEDLRNEVDELRAENAALRSRLGEVDEVHTQNEHLRQQLANETARREHERQAKRDIERQAKREQERQARREEKLEAQRQAKLEEERQARQEEEQQAQQELERQAQEEQRHIQEEERRARREEERQARREERQSRERREKNTQTRIADRVQEELRNSKLTAAAQSSVQQPQPRFSRYASAQFSSDSQRVPMPAAPIRSVSNPDPTGSRRGLYQSQKPESTTDLSLTNMQTPGMMSGGRNGMQEAVEAKPVEAPSFDLTELSFINPDDIAQLRKKLEQERAAARKMRASAQTAPAPTTRDETVRSMASAKSARPQSFHGLSTKDVTAQSNFTAQTEHTTEHTGNFTSHSNRSAKTQAQQPDESILSNSSRRRRSAPVEETSAFIVPDITMGGRKQPTITLGKIRLPSHDNKNCTVCARESQQAGDSVAIPYPIPVSSRTEDDVDATMRPSQSPKNALAKVIKELQDELSHLHLELAAHEALLRAHDTSLGRRKRKAIQEAMEDLLRMIDIKSDQIYDLYDVVEGQKADDMTEQEMEDTLRSITEAAKSKAATKKVVVESHHSDSESDDESLPRIDDEDEDLPFEGFSDTESLPIFGKAGRLGVF
ncbi:uncharacterized protein BDZ99DRAFT_576984 [Mytilinidion resinicola]|uniref:Cep57 centrosome microtubule-binding domain-containing protein n=1 Tax=Mytilinidion resinicola TaxID=574789 RepID=A0A6A6Y0D8_9PEZI|nr:uncharacterized protein BDZ99DRAFT_576984 [Mytilinidion resinicola]KAF2802286.1 hypothetical protein BDZ99DRAFT_576984 [Mytilinidion resinicola]